jgi:hypothetical protein
MKEQTSLVPATIVLVQKKEPALLGVQPNKEIRKLAH